MQAAKQEHGRTWKLATPSPLSTEPCRAVWCEETDETGYRAVRWVSGRPQLYGPVYASAECTGHVLDFHPHT